MTWNQTNDSLFFDIINQDLAIWFIEQSNLLGKNRYALGDQTIDAILQATETGQLINEEIEYINTVNSILTKFKLPALKFPTDWYNQSQLNQLHKDWADTRYAIPNLTELLYKIDKKFFEAYQEMNCHIHLIEKSFRYKFRDNTHWRTDNPFKDNVYDWEMCHLYLEYPGHGRAAFEKYQWLDDDDNMYTDNNNWDNIDSYLGMELGRPYKTAPPDDFLRWCKEKNLVPHGYTLPLANLTDWRNTLTSARKTVTENVKINDNYFSLKIVK